MRLSVGLLLVSLLGVVAGGWLIGRWALGVAVIFDSLCVGGWALLRDDGRGEPAGRAVVGQVPVRLGEVLDRARAS
jgi:hypothetical protein